MTLTNVSLSKQLKEGTKKSHSAAENTKFVKGFLKGVVNEEEYRKLLTNFWYVYDTMEQRIKETRDPIATVLHKYQPIINRTAFLEQDLRYYYGPMWREQQIPSEACNTYCYRINEIAANDPYLLIAHHYTRYIGDLSGGQILKGIAQKALQPAKGSGLMFYEFPRVPDAKKFKDEYRADLDSLDINESDRNILIDEANYAFLLNMHLFDEIQGNATKSLWKVLWGYITGS
jgi:heme oxygenase|tara:strand:+ start:769 stop:1461 length:693 start_codon:yes stop_codon:yes gene_type:complete